MRNVFFCIVFCFLITIGLFSNLTFAEVTPINTVTPSTTPILPNPLAGETGSATNVTSSSATLNGSVYGRSSISAWFEYGINSNSYDSTSSIQIVNAGPFGVPVSISVSGLSAATRYYYRLVAQNDYDTVYGSEESFTTLTATPTVVPTPVCEVEFIEVSPKRIILKMGQSNEVTVTLEGDDCVPEGRTITTSISKIVRKRINVTPTSQETDENGKAKFIIATKNKAGNVRVTFKVNSLRKSIIVKVRR